MIFLSIFPDLSSSDDDASGFFQNERKTYTALNGDDLDRATAVAVALPSQDLIDRCSTMYSEGSPTVLLPQ